MSKITRNEKKKIRVSKKSLNYFMKILSNAAAWRQQIEAGNGHNTQWITSANSEHATAVVLTTTEF